MRSPGERIRGTSSEKQRNVLVGRYTPVVHVLEGKSRKREKAGGQGRQERKEGRGKRRRSKERQNKRRE